MAKYKYYINDIEVFPLNAVTEQYKYEKTNDPGAVFSFEIETPFVFKYSDPNSAFNFKDQETNDLCFELPFKITRRCGNTWAIFWEGIFAITEGKFDDNTCQYEIKPRRKEYILADLEINIFDEPNRLFEDGVDGVLGTRPLDGAVFTYHNWRYFDKLVLYIAQRCNPKITGLISNFFQINPDGPYPFAGTNHFTKMAFTSVSQIKDPVPSQDATREVITFRQLMADLNVLFQVQWFIDTNYNLRVEHDVYFEGIPGLDLTAEKYRKYLLGKTNYAYNLDEYPKKETFKIAEHKSSCSLVYSGLANIAKSQNEKTYTTSVIRTGWAEAFDSDNNGVFLAATDGGSLTGEWRNLMGAGHELYLNPKYLVLTCHTYLRPSLYALFYYYQNNSDNAVIAAGLILDSVKPTKAREEISFPLCCDEEFNINDQVNTEMGTGYVSKAGFDSRSELLKLVLKYKIDNCSNFVPDQLDCPISLWLKYNDVVISPPFGKASQWNDSSGNNRHAVQAVTDEMPVYASNTPVPSGALQFYNQNDPDSPPQFGMNLKTPAFQLFPGKRGTIFIVFNSGFGKFGGTGSNLTSPVGFGGTILSTQDGGSDKYFDLSGDGTFNSFAEGVNYPQGPGYIGTPGFVSFADLGSNSVMVIRRAADISIDVSWNGIPSPNNPMFIANDQPDSKPLVIGFNDQAKTFPSTIVTTMSELLIFDCALTDEQIEKVLFYFIKNQLLTI